MGKWKINFDEEEDSDEEDSQHDILCGIIVSGILFGHSLHRQMRIPCRTSARSGAMFIREVLEGHPIRCYQDFRLHKEVFISLCEDLKCHYGFVESRELSIEESLGIFLMTLAHGVGNRLVQETFNHSGETIHRHFHMILRAVCRLSKDLIRPNNSYNEECPSYIRHNSRYWPYFKNCIGAIDGTHVKASVREGEQTKWIGRKGYPTQNVLAVCDFNMCFTYVLAGWEGSAHDTRIFTDTIRRPDGNFPHPSGEKYYLVDAGYPNSRGYLAPYKGTHIRYHFQDFRRGKTRGARTPKGT